MEEHEAEVIRKLALKITLIYQKNLTNQDQIKLKNIFQIQEQGMVKLLFFYQKNIIH